MLVLAMQFSRNGRAERPTQASGVRADATRRSLKTEQRIKAGFDGGRPKPSTTHRTE